MTRRKATRKPGMLRTLKMLSLRTATATSKGRWLRTRLHSEWHSCRQLRRTAGKPLEEEEREEGEEEEEEEEG